MFCGSASRVSTVRRSLRTKIGRLGSGDLLGHLPTAAEDGGLVEVGPCVGEVLQGRGNPYREVDVTLVVVPLLDCPDEGLNAFVDEALEPVSKSMGLPEH